MIIFNFLSISKNPSFRATPIKKPVGRHVCCHGAALGVVAMRAIRNSGGLFAHQGFNPPIRRWLARQALGGRVMPTWALAFLPVAWVGMPKTTSRF
jgi:hypothetical protein